LKYQYASGALLVLEKNRSGDGTLSKRNMLDFSLVRRAHLKPDKNNIHTVFGKRKDSMLLCYVPGHCLMSHSLSIVNGSSLHKTGTTCWLFLTNNVLRVFEIY
jgi:hypothetical protein